jgi:hypothetical protein
MDDRTAVIITAVVVVWFLAMLVWWVVRRWSTGRLARQLEPTMRRLADEHDWTRSTPRLLHALEIAHDWRGELAGETVCCGAAPGA